MSIDCNNAPWAYNREDWQINGATNNTDSVPSGPSENYSGNDSGFIS